MTIDSLIVESPGGRPGAVTVMPDVDALSQNDHSLRGAAPGQFRVGAYMQMGGVPGGGFNDSPEHRATLAREFNTMTIGTSFKSV